MISITIPASFAPEVQYTFSILLEEFLGQPCTYTIDKKTIDYKISFSTEKEVIIKNEFFNNYSDENTYLTKRALPTHIIKWSDRDHQIEQLPILYGAAGIKEINETITIQADLIASSFFMLSRWEEVVDDDLDLHDRCQGKNSIAYKNNFLHRPIVNEYAEVLWSIFTKAGYTGKRSKHSYSNVITHDVDQPYQWPDWNTSIKHLGGDLIKRRDLSLATSNLKSFYRTKIHGDQDPFDQHQYLLDLADKNNYKACFNFIISNRSRYDQALSMHDPRLKSLIDRIEAAGHQIGYHPGYNVHLDQNIFNEELALLQTLVKQDIISGRQHFLRFKTPDTWRLWDKSGMQWESTMGYSDLPGFRCGTCYTYTVFDCKARKKLSIKEKPLILMDATLVYYQKSIDLDSLYALKNQCKKHHGEWVTIWHNDLVKHPMLKDFESLCIS